MEKVMVVKKDILINSGFRDEAGFFTENIEKITETVLNNYFFIERGLAENDFLLKQIIPYAVVKNGGRYLMMKRLTGQSEKRLHGLLSIGVGGHINESEAGENILLKGMTRELNEEIAVKYSDMKLIGVLNNPADDVGRVHLGFVYLIIADGDFLINEPDKMTGEWALPEELVKSIDRMEGWSALLISRLFP